MTSCENCPFRCGETNGVTAGERLFKVRAWVSGRHEMVSCFCRLSDYTRSGFQGYSRDENGAIDGVIFRCDLGYGYGFDDGTRLIALHPHETDSFIHSYSDTSDGSWDDGSFSVYLTLIPFDEAECFWRSIDD